MNAYRLFSGSSFPIVWSACNEGDDIFLGLSYHGNDVEIQFVIRALAGMRCDGAGYSCDAAGNRRCREYGFGAGFCKPGRGHPISTPRWWNPDPPDWRR